jgi:ABC-type transporter Mla subunit MlaD
MNQDIHTHLEKLKGELEKLSPAIQHLQKADENTSAVVTAAKNLHKEYAAHLQKIEELMVATNRDHQKEISKTIGESVKKMDDATNSFGKIQGEFETTVKLFIDKYKRLADSATHLVKTIEGVDFPNRLEKIDTTVSSINQGLQNVQQRVGDTERNLKDDLQAKSKEMTGKIEGSEKEIKQQLGAVQKENQLLKILLFVALALSVTTIIVLFVKL